MLILRELRIEKGTTQQQISDFLGVSRPTYTRYENGEREPSLATIMKLSEFFEVTIDNLFGKETQKNEISRIDGDILKAASGLSDDDKMNLIRYVDFIKKRNAAM